MKILVFAISTPIMILILIPISLGWFLVLIYEKITSSCQRSDDDDAEEIENFAKLK